MKHKKTQEHTIWSNYIDSIEPIAQALCEEDGNDFYDLTIGEHGDYAIRACEINDEYLQDEQDNLSHLTAPGEIVALADLGLWNGRVTGYKELHTNKIADVLNEWSGCDFIRFYIDERNNLRSRGDHHDGRNYTLFRAFRENISDEQKDNFLLKVWKGTVTGKDITRYTKRLGDLVSSVYGW